MWISRYLGDTIDMRVNLFISQISRISQRCDVFCLILASVTTRDYQGQDNTLLLVNTETACRGMLFEGVSPPHSITR